MQIIQEQGYWDLFQAIEISEDRIAIHVFEPVDRKSLPGNLTILEFKTMMSDLKKQNVSGLHLPPDRIYSKGPDGLSKVLSYAGSSALIVDQLSGRREWTDYSLFECPLHRDFNPGAWRNRFPYSSLLQVDRTTRWSQVQNEGIFASLFVPFAGKGLSDTTLYISSNLPLYFMDKGFKIAKTLNRSELKPNHRPFYLDWYWSVKSDSPVSMRPNSTIEVPVHLIWNRDGSNCNRAATLSVESDAGYLPCRRVKFDNSGSAKIRISSTGMQLGEKIKVKFNAEAYTNLSSFEIKIS